MSDRSNEPKLGTNGPAENRQSPTAGPEPVVTLVRSAEQTADRTLSPAREGEPAFGAAIEQGVQESQDPDFAGDAKRAPASAARGRRNYFVNPKFQLSFLGYTLGVTLLTVTIFYLSDLYFFWRFKDGGRVLGLPPNHPYFGFLVEQEKVRFWIFATAAGVSALFLAVSGLLFSHRIAGPLHRLKSHFLMVANEVTLDDVRFRRDDFFHDVAENFNMMMAKLRKDRIDASLEVQGLGGETSTQEQNNSSLSSSTVSNDNEVGADAQNQGDRGQAA